MARKSDLTRRIQIFIDGSNAQKSVEELEDEVAGLTAELGKLDHADKDFDKRSKELKKTIDAKNKTLENYRKRVAETKRVLDNLSGATYNELIAVQKKLQKEISNSVPGTKNYTRALEQQKRVSESLARVHKDMQSSVGSQATIFSRIAAGVNKYATAISAAVAGLTGLTLTVRKAVNDYAEMEEAMAQVRKYTGLSKEGVDDLNESLKQIDTRTSRERLNELAGDAGRLGITGKEGILEFVDAADKINVALGEDLGEDAVKNIGKLAQMFGESDRLGLRGAMLATGSAVNELAQNSSASEPYIVEFTARLAGVAQQAKISQADIMGYASALDQNMQQMETAATVMSQLITKMFQQPARFAELAGMQVKEFSELIARDANAALLRLLGTMQAKGGFDALAPMFEEMKLNGTRAVGVLSAVASHIDQVRDAQDLANKAYNDGTSILNEFNVQNNTVQAGLDKAKKKFHEVSVQLGEKLQPLSKKLITSTSASIRLLNTLIDFVDEHIAVITVAVSSLAAYSAAVLIANSRLVTWVKTLKAANKEQALANSVSAVYKGVTLLLSAAFNALTGNITRARAAIRLFNTTLKASPWGAAAAAVTAIGVGIYGYIEKQREAYKVTREMNKELATEQTGLDSLFDALRRAGQGTQTRRDLIKSINEKYGQYLPDLLDEKSTLDEVNAAYKRINASLTEQIALKFKNQEITAVAEKEGAKQIELLENARQRLTKSFKSGTLSSMAIAELKEVTRNYYEAGASWEKAYASAFDTIRKKYFGNKSLGSSAAEDMQEYVESYYKMRGQLAEIDRKYEVHIKNGVKPGNELDEVTVTATRKETPLSQASDPLDDKELNKARKSRLEALKTEYVEEQAELKRLYAQGNDEMLQTEQQFNARMLEIKKDYLQKVIEAAGAGTREAADAENEMAEIQLQERKDAVQRAIEQENALYAEEQRKLQEEYINRSDERIDSEESYNELREQLEMLHLERMLQIVGLDADSRMQIEQQVRDFQMKCVSEALAAKRKADEQEVKDAEEKKKKLLQVAETQRQTLEGYAKSFGDAVGRVLSGQEDALKAFSDSVIDIVFDVLEKIIEAKIAEATATAVAAQAKSTAESFATADSVLTFGASGAARAAVMSALIMGALAAAKATLKGLLGGGSGKSSSTGGETTSSPKVYQRVAQHASGRYQVIGEQDGRRYDVPFIGPAPTGIVRSPALVAENGSELIINAEDLQRLQKHMNYPLVLQAIAESRRPQPVVQHAQGSYPQDTEQVAPSVAGGDNVMRRLAEVLEKMERNGVKAPVVLSEIEKKKLLLDAARKIGSK